MFYHLTMCQIVSAASVFASISHNYRLKKRKEMFLWMAFLVVAFQKVKHKTCGKEKELLVENKQTLLCDLTS